MQEIRNTLNIKLLQKAKTWKGVALSDSMSPLIEEGDCIFFKKISPLGIKKFDIIAYIGKDKKIRVHRVVTLHIKKIITVTTRGDNLKKNDIQFSASHILAKAIRIEGKYGTIDLTKNYHYIFFYLTKTAVTTYIAKIFLWFHMKLRNKIIYA